MVVLLSIGWADAIVFKQLKKIGAKKYILVVI